MIRVNEDRCRTLVLVPKNDYDPNLKILMRACNRAIHVVMFQTIDYVPNQDILDWIKHENISELSPIGNFDIN